MDIAGDVAVCDSPSDLPMPKTNGYLSEPTPSERITIAGLMDEHVHPLKIWQIIGFDPSPHEKNKEKKQSKVSADAANLFCRL